MADHVLSREEITALLTPGEGEIHPRAGGKTIVDGDLTHPSRLSTVQLAMLRRLNERVAGLLASTVSVRLGCDAHGTLASLSQLSLATFRASLRSPTVVYTVAAPPLAGKLLLTFDAGFALALIDRLLGGPGAPPETSRDLSKLELDLLDDIARGILAQIAIGWQDLAAFHPVIDDRTTDPASVTAIPSAETMLVASFQIHAGMALAAGTVSCCLPLVTLEGAVDIFASPPRFAATQQGQTAAQRQHLDQVVGQARLSGTVALGSTRLTVARILSLRPGDVLVLDRRAEEPLPLTIAGKVRAHGRPGRVGRHLALVVERTVPLNPGSVSDRSDHG